MRNVKDVGLLLRNFDQKQHATTWLQPILAALQTVCAPVCCVLVVWIADVLVAFLLIGFNRLSLYQRDVVLLDVVLDRIAPCLLLRTRCKRRGVATDSPLPILLDGDLSLARPSLSMSALTYRPNENPNHRNLHHLLGQCGSRLGPPLPPRQVQLGESAGLPNVSARQR
jgi:hypothetical protein